MLATFKLFYRYIRPYRRRFIFGLLALLVVDLLNALPPLVLKSFIDHAAHPESFSPFLWLGAAYAMIAIGQGVCRYLWRIYLIQASYQAAEQLREDYFAKLQKLPPTFYDKIPIGDLMALATNDVEAVRFAIGPGLLVFCDALFLFLSLPPAMLWLSPKLTLLSLAPTVILPFLIARSEKLVHEKFSQVQAQFSKLSGFAQENIEGIRVIKAFVREWNQLERFANLGKEFVRLNLKLTKVQSIFDPLYMLTVSAGMFMLLTFAGPDVIAGVVGLGTFVAFTRYLDNLTWPMMAFGMAVTHYQRGKTSLERIQDVLTQIEPEKPAPRALPVLKAETPLLEGRHLTFSYGDRKVLNDVSFKINAGQRVAIVGPVGSGKSTLVRLITGLYEVPRGMLFWNGVDIRDLNLEQRRELLAIVPQEAFLFSESLGWNVALGPYDSARAHSALKQAGLGAEASSWGLETVIGEKGLNLSGGQRARVALARALHRIETPGRLLVMDNALSSVDAKTEAEILDSLERLPGLERQTLLMITHRFARLHHFDQALVLRDGVLVQSGPPKKLADDPGLYRQLLELQRMESALA